MTTATAFFTFLSFLSCRSGRKRGGEGGPPGNCFGSQITKSRNGGETQSQNRRAQEIMSGRRSAERHTSARISSQSWRGIANHSQKGRHLVHLARESPQQSKVFQGIKQSKKARYFWERMVYSRRLYTMSRRRNRWPPWSSNMRFNAK